VTLGGKGRGGKSVFFSRKEEEKNIDRGGGIYRPKSSRGVTHGRSPDGGKREEKD